MSTIQDDIDLFFTDPLIEPKPTGVFSVLYLLRRDIKQCMDAGQILWPATIAILAGVDLLGKFYAGDDSSGKVGRRFRDFINKYFQPLSPEDANIVYQLRNALLHSFGLYSRKQTKTRTDEYYFTLILPEAGPLVVRHASKQDRYLISILALYNKFETAIERYHEDIVANADLQNKFSKMYGYYGTISIVPEVRVYRKTDDDKQ